MFDTHTHLNFKAFKKNLDEVINKSKKAGVKYFLIPGTDVKTSIKAVEIAEKYEGIYAAAGIHPHHVYEFVISPLHSVIPTEMEGSLSKKEKGIPRQARNDIWGEMEQLENLLSNKKVVAIGEVGLDRHEYGKTKYEDYQVNEKFINLQKELLIEQIKLAIKYNKSLILHNREAIDDTLTIIEKHWDNKLSGRTVFHCCEPELRLLEFAKKHEIYIGVDGDITYDQEKQDFIRSVPQDLLVVETDSPFLLPEPLKTERKSPNIPANLKYIVESIAKVQGRTIEDVIKSTTGNSLRLFGI